MTGPLSDRDMALIGVSLATGVALGMWLGIWTVPTSALAVPTETTTTGDLIPRYRPVTGTHLILTIGLPAAGVWYSRYRTRDEEETEDGSE